MTGLLYRTCLLAGRVYPGTAWFGLWRFMTRAAQADKQFSSLQAHALARLHSWLRCYLQGLCVEFTPLLLLTLLAAVVHGLTVHVIV